MGIAIRLVAILGVVLGVTLGCQSKTPDSEFPTDASVSIPADSGPKGNSCGSTATVLDIGADEPFVEVPQRDQRHTYQIFEGHQGGYHIDVSVRVTGGLDPDEVNVAMEVTRGDKTVARHTIDQWYLKLIDDRSHCEYPKGQLVFAEESGQLYTLEQVQGLLDEPLNLRVKMDGSNESVSSSFKIVLTDVVRLSENPDAGVENTP